MEQQGLTPQGLDFQPINPWDRERFSGYSVDYENQVGIVTTEAHHMEVM